MLAEEWRRGRDARRACRRARMGPRPGQRVRARDARAAPAALAPRPAGMRTPRQGRGSGRPGCRQHRAGRAISARPGGEPLGEDRDELLAVLDAVAVRGESRVGREVRVRSRGTSFAHWRSLPTRWRSGRPRSRRSRTGRCSGGRCRAAGRRAGHERDWAWLRGSPACSGAARRRSAGPRPAGAGRPRSRASSAGQDRDRPEQPA